MLVFFSDMRQATGTLDPTDAMQRVSAKCLSADVRGVEVYAFGADANGVSLTYWKNLRAFWYRYLRAVGATVKEYSVLRDARSIFPN